MLINIYHTFYVIHYINNNKYLYIWFYRSKLDEMKTMQKLRDRPNGVNIVSLALGEKLSQDEEKLMVSKLNWFYNINDNTTMQII